MANNADTYQKCPLCAAYFRRADLKAVKFVPATPPDAQRSPFLFRLLNISRGSLSPYFPGTSNNNIGGASSGSAGDVDQVHRGPVVGAAVDVSTLFCGIDEAAAPIPMDGRARGKYSRIVYASTQRFQQLLQEERKELLAYREECLKPQNAYLNTNATATTTAVSSGQSTSAHPTTSTAQRSYAGKITAAGVDNFPPLSVPPQPQTPTPPPPPEVASTD